MIESLEAIYNTIPERAEPDRDLYAVRRKNELKRMLEAHFAGGNVQIVRIEGDPPYDVYGYNLLLKTPHLIYSSFPRWIPDGEIAMRVLTGAADIGSLSIQRLIPLRIELPDTHPDRKAPPRITLLDHRVFNPSVIGSQICWSEQWNPTSFITEIVDEISVLLRFEGLADLNRPLNPQAAQWVLNGHPDFHLPLI